MKEPRKSSDTYSSKYQTSFYAYGQAGRMPKRGCETILLIELKAQIL